MSICLMPRSHATFMYSIGVRIRVDLVRGRDVYPFNATMEFVMLTLLKTRE
jgi:hypothetical protein